MTIQIAVIATALAMAVSDPGTRPVYVAISTANGGLGL